MTSTVAIIGKSGSGKTTTLYHLARIIKEKFKESSILLVDNDLTGELAGFFGLETKKTIYGIRSGKHEYNTGIPDKMTKQEYIEWALEDILVELEPNVDLIVSWLVASKDCRCPITKQMNDALVKLVESYDFVLFDCEYDLKYLNQLVDYPIDTTLLVSKTGSSPVKVIGKIFDNSKKYVMGGQFGVLLNKTKENETPKTIEAINSMGISLIGVIPDFGEKADEKEFENCLRAVYTRLNLPQG